MRRGAKLSLINCSLTQWTGKEFICYRKIKGFSKSFNWGPTPRTSIMVLEFRILDIFGQRCFHSFQSNIFERNLKSSSPFYSAQYWWQRFCNSPHFPGCFSTLFNFLPVIISQKQCLKNSILKAERRASKQLLTHSQLIFHNNIRTSLSQTQWSTVSWYPTALSNGEGQIIFLK